MGELMTGEKTDVLKHVFHQYDRQGKGELTPLEVQMLHADIRMGGISYPQVCLFNNYVHAVLPLFKKHLWEQTTKVVVRRELS